MKDLRPIQTSREKDDKKSSSGESGDLLSDGEPGESSEFSFGGKVIRVSKSKRKSQSWPEGDLVEWKRKCVHLLLHSRGRQY